MHGNVIYLRKDLSAMFNGFDYQQLAWLAHVTSIYSNLPGTITVDTIGFVPIDKIQAAVETVWKRHQRYGDVLSEEGLKGLESLPKGFKVLIT